jgi:hypothetical protein
MKNIKNILLGLLLLSAGSISIAEDEATTPDTGRGPGGENFKQRMHQDDQGQGERRNGMNNRRGERDRDGKKDFREERRPGPDGNDDQRRDRRRHHMENDGDGEDNMSNEEHRRHKKKDRSGEKETAEPRGKLRDPAEFQQVVNDYKSYVAKVSPEIREEVIAFRKEVARLNKEKGELYKKLSTPAQEYLNKERQYKKKLPTNRKDLMKVDKPDAPAAAQ